jgi:hypothetical protein
MSKSTRKIKENLNTIIKRMSKNAENFVKRPGKDFTRKRKLPFAETLKILLSMGGNSLSSELLEYFNYSVETATSSAFIQQRSKINDSALPFLFRQFTNTFRNLETHKGYRVLAADGSALNICTNPGDAETYFQSTPEYKGYNQLHINVLYDLCSKLYTDIDIQPRRKMNENLALVGMIDNSQYPEKTIIIADRNYECYNTFAHIEQMGHKYAIRVKDVNSSGMLRGLELPKTNEFDVDISLKLTRKQTKEVKANPHIYKFLPVNVNFDYLERKSTAAYPISFRVVRFEIANGKYECIITNLDKNDFSPPEMKSLYQMRWGIETSFRELKYSIGLIQLHAKKSEFVKQEIFARLIMYNFCSMMINAVVIKQKSTKYVYQANFTMAVQICKSFFRGRFPPDDVVLLIQKYILPLRKRLARDRNIRPKFFVCFNYRVA